MNKSIPFVSKETLENSILYEPIKSMVPYIFPTLFDEVEEMKNDIV